MIAGSHYEKILLVIKENSVILFATIFIIFINCLMSSYKNEKFTELQCIRDTKTVIKKLSISAPQKKHLANHLFSDKDLNFEDFITKIGKESLAKISSIEPIEESVIGTIKTKKFAITGVFWHELFIFEFLDKLQKLSPSFSKILSIEINKFAKIAYIKPIIKVDIICITYQK
jgi:hypothetical protein